jgi:hypothetical protein
MPISSRTDPVIAPKPTSTMTPNTPSNTPRIRRAVIGSSRVRYVRQDHTANGHCGVQDRAQTGWNLPLAKEDQAKRDLIIDECEDEQSDGQRAIPGDTGSCPTDGHVQCSGSYAHPGENHEERRKLGDGDLDEEERPSPENRENNEPSPVRRVKSWGCGGADAHRLFPNISQPLAPC